MMNGESFLHKWLSRLQGPPGPQGATGATGLPGEPGLVYGIMDPDYAKAFTIIRCTAWMYGYAVGMHGSFTRDLDLMIVPWEPHCHARPEHLINLLAERTGTKIKHGGPTQKPHGRLTWTLYLPDFGDPRWIDVSFMPKGVTESPEQKEP